MSGEVAHDEIAAYARDLSSKDARFVFAPVRHHSPACAVHVRALIREIKPKRVFVEAPVDLEPLIPLLLDEATVPPVAFAVFLDEESELKTASYYPFCAHSPEYVAMQTAREVGASVHFIDLPSGDRLMHGASTMHEEDNEDATTEAARPGSFLDDRLLDLSEYTAALAQQLGCRDGFEVWDHLFERRITDTDSRTFFSDVGAYCHVTRTATPVERITAEETPREDHMLACLQANKRKHGRSVVVTGGFHTPALLDGLRTTHKSERKSVSPTRSAQTKAYLVRYGFEQLDYLHGYGAGLPSPGYYDRLWRAYEASDGASSDFWSDTTIELFTDFSDASRRNKATRAYPVSVLNGAVRSALDIARLRGRSGPLRVDIMDAALGNFVKGEASVSTEMESFETFLTGNAVGNVPPSAGSPPLVEHVRARAKAHKFNLQNTMRVTRELDIHRKPAHLETSRFLHLLLLLDVDLGRLEAGPDFVQSGASDVLFERWSWAWSPQGEAALIEKSWMGDTLERAGVTVIERQIKALGESGEARNARACVQIFLGAMRAGLHSRARRILDAVNEEIYGDPDFISVCAALQSLLLAFRARSILGLIDFPPVLETIKACYMRALYLMPTLAQGQEEDAVRHLEAIVTLNEAIRDTDTTSGVLDEALFDDALDNLARLETAPALSGGLGAIRFAAHRCTVEELVSLVEGNLKGAYADPADKIGVLQGVLKVSPELMRRLPELIAAVDAVITCADDEDFVELLPHLRLAFSSLNPRETDAVSEAVATLHGASPKSVIMPVFAALSDAETSENLMLMSRMTDALSADGLLDWVEETRDSVSEDPS